MKQNESIKNLLLELAQQYSGYSKQNLNDVLIVSVQHILETTYDMLDAMTDYGFKNIIIAGKHYSSNEQTIKKISSLGIDYVCSSYQLGYGRFDDCMNNVAHRVWQLALKKIETQRYKTIIILDDGADLLKATPGALFKSINNKPKFVIGIEQTRGGTNRSDFIGIPFSIIDVAGCCVKTLIEYPKIAEIVAKTLSDILTNKYQQIIPYSSVIGILGYGAMGKAIAKKLLQKGHKVIVYDPLFINKPEVNNKICFYNQSSVLISNADVIIGCTGNDVTQNNTNLNALFYSQKNKVLISTSSKDHEFNRLLRFIQNKTKKMGVIPDPLEDISFKNHVGSTINILRGGFPVNFKNELHCVPPEHIWPTRAALMLSCIYATQLSNNTSSYKKGNIDVTMVPTKIQKIILKKYISENANDPLISHLKLINNDKYLEINSDSDEIRALKNSAMLDN